LWLDFLLSPVIQVHNWDLMSLYDSVMKVAPLLVIPARDAGMALLHGNLCCGDLWQIHVTFSNLAMPMSVNLLSK